MLTNKLHLPEPFYQAALKRLYSKGPARYSVTELIDPARLGALKRLYDKVIVEDIADNIASLMGTLFHKMLQDAGAGTTGAILEERLYAEVDGTLISGAMDHVLLKPDGTLTDYKTCKVYAVLLHKRYGKHDWIAQTNIYRYLQALHGRTVDSLKIVPWMKDWDLGRAIASAEKGGDYPEHEIVELDVPVWSLEDTERYIKERIAAHVEADRWAASLNDTLTQVDEQDIEPLCTDEERWRDKHYYVVMSPKRKSAHPGKYDTEGEARYAATQVKDGYVAERGGLYKRCLLYCPVGRAGLCSQWERDKAATPTAGFIDTSAFDESP